jgi:hypothetical protein
MTGLFVHLISRFVDGRFLFDDPARAEYLRLLALALRHSAWRLVSYALMSSHIHLGLISGRDALDRWIHRVHGGIAEWLTVRRRAEDDKTRGHVFADRPKTLVSPLSAAPTVIMYHHQNPGSAGVVDDPSQSTWTSHRAYVGVDPTPEFLDVTLGLGLCGYRADDAGRSAFDEAVRARRITRDDIDGLPTVQVPYEADDTALRLVEALDAAEIAQLASIGAGVLVGEMRGKSRRPAVVKARRVALLAWTELGGRQAEMTRYLGLSAAAASYLVTSAAGLEREVARVARGVRGRARAA